ncbi:2-keto-4-pentenoate hydratase [Hoyosella subflava]|uniref:2-keto-4-pentenoate hydratase n=1 Tax=Hoyosella subflava TaxID=639313 RepID=UPI00059C6937
MTTVAQRVVDTAAGRLSAAAATKTPSQPIRDLIGTHDIDSAYRIQSVNIAAELARGKRVVGRKIGLTAQAVQNQLGVDQPDFGVLLDDMDCTGEPTIDITRLLQPRIEAEIAFVLSHDITDEIDAATAPHYVQTVFAAFEIVDSRVANWDISLADTVADNASSGLYVLGQSLPVEAVPPLSEVTMTLLEDGKEVSHGRGSDCLGSPWNALAWLANTSRAYGSILREGDVVLSGALGPIVPVSPGGSYHASITGIGDVSATFTTA